ncbi:hypothetical protein [Streptomyces sp. NPDC004533]|uniref:hypothetical protein n=1 Tax=Streptomyces sp. NPDC004533 TaxID=3154278 RepID=UPI00339F7102
MVDRFVAGRKDLTAVDREMLLGWRDPVEGIFEIQRREKDAVVLLNLDPSIGDRLTVPPWRGRAL